MGDKTARADGGINNFGCTENDSSNLVRGKSPIRIPGTAKLREALRCGKLQDARNSNFLYISSDGRVLRSDLRTAALVAGRKSAKWCGPNGSLACFSVIVTIPRRSLVGSGSWW